MVPTDSALLARRHLKASDLRRVLKLIRRGRRAVDKGLCVVPEPDDVAIWGGAACSSRFGAYRDGNPIQDRSVRDPAFEGSLARYAATV